MQSSDASSDERDGAPEGLAGDDPLTRQRAFERWQDTNRLQPRLLERLRQVALELAPGAPRVSLLLPLHQASVARADACIASVRAQLLDGWELCVLDDGTSGPYLGPKLRGLAEVDPRIRVFSAPRSLAGAAALELLLKEATGELVAILDPDVVLAPDALLHVIARLRSEPHLQLLYTDEDSIDASGRRFAPRFKPPWSPALALSFDYLGRLTVFRRALLERIGGPDAAMGSAHERDLVMRAAEAAGDDHIGHIAKIACHRSPSRALDAAAEDDPDARCIAAALARRGLHARPVRIDARDADPEAPTHALVWSPALLRETPVTILIPTRDRIDLLRRCVASLERTVDAEALSLLIVDDHSEERQTLAYLRELESHPRVRVVRPTRPRTGFDFAHLVNFGVSHVTTPYVLLLNNDTEAIAPGWLEEMVGWASVPGVAVVGARLTFPDRTIAHAGVVIGPQGGLADHVFRGSPRDSPGYLGLAHRARDVSAVTGACLLTSTAIYRELGGLDEERFAVDYNDNDYCLRVLASGRRVVFTPRAELTHVGGASRGIWDDVTEQASFLRIHAAFHDRYTNPSCDIESAELQIDPTRFTHADHAPDGLRVLVVPSTSPSDASSELSDHLDGLVRADPTLRVEILARDVRFEGDVDRWHGRVRAVAGELAEQEADLVIAHGTHAIWGVELARLLGCPSVWYLGGRGDAGELAHELGADPQARALFERSLARATRVVFASALCLPAFAPLDRGHHRALPIGVSIPRIESFRRAHSRAELRARHRASQDELLVLIVDEGGGADDERGRHVRSALSDLGERVRCFALRGSLAEPLDGGPTLARCDLLGMADLLVMSDGTSEIHPRVLLEALSLGVPVIGPGVPGVGEVVADELSGFIADAASRESIERALRRWIDDAPLRAAFGVRAGVQARRLMDTSRSIERHVALLREAVLAG